MRVRKRDTNMKVYARQKTRKVVYGKVVLGITNEQFMKQIDWVNKGWIKKTTYLQEEYIQIKKELKAKNLIQ